MVGLFKHKHIVNKTIRSIREDDGGIIAYARHLCCRLAEF